MIRDLCAKISVTSTVVFSLIYPAVLYFGAGVIPLTSLAMVGLVLLGARFLTIPAGAGLQPLLVFSAPALLLGVVAFRGSTALALFYPSMLNLALMGLFLITLYRPPSMAERLARLYGMPMTAAGIEYTRVLTLVWAGFFLLNALIAAALAVAGNLRAWAVFCGLISYVAVAVLMGAELIFRRYYRRRVHMYSDVSLKELQAGPGSRLDAG